MKKLLTLLISLLLTISLCACGNKEEDSKTTSSKNDTSYSVPSEDVDIDLTQLSSTMVYSEVLNMVNSPEDYLGKTVRAYGTFAVSEDESTGKIYFACIIQDATACCAQGIEFVLGDEYVYPNDYPELDSYITVSGTFNSYVEDGYTYCQLLDATMEY